MFEGRYIINPLNPKGNFSEVAVLIDIINTMGMPPPDFLRQCKRTAGCFDGNGQWVFPHMQVQPKSRELPLTRQISPESERQFRRFLGKFLQPWSPTQRPTAADLLADEFLSWEECSIGEDDVRARTGERQAE